jgi:hypothetical protein
MRHAFPVLALATLALPLGACSDYASDRPGPGYRDDGGYVLNDNDPVYRDNNGNYYCKKPDGTTGAIVGGLAGGVLGNIIAPGGSKTLGTIIGAGVGAVAGHEIEKGRVRCR